jgi:hypothetical protein
MKISKSSRIWILILGIGLFGGLSGAVENGWSEGDSIGLTVWCVLAIYIGVIIWRENRTPN